jgi:uncharacterized protein YecT (DUF1311 family)
MTGLRKRDRGRYVLLVSILTLTLLRTALAETPDPIDAGLSACLGTASSVTTMGIVDCTATAIKAWDKRLNDVYRKTMGALDPKSQELLRASQRKWIAFREAERAALSGPWRNDAGTLANIMEADGELGAIKERVRELAIYQGG